MSVGAITELVTSLVNGRQVRVETGYRAWVVTLAHFDDDQIPLTKRLTDCYQLLLRC